MSLAENRLGHEVQITPQERINAFRGKTNGLVDLMIFSLVDNYLKHKTRPPETSSANRFLDEYTNLREQESNPFEAMYIATDSLIETYASKNQVSKFIALTLFTSSAIRRSIGIRFADEGDWEDDTPDGTVGNDGLTSQERSAALWEGFAQGWHEKHSDK